MVLHDFLRNRQAQTTPIFLAEADEWLKQFSADSGVDAWAIITETEFYSLRRLGNADDNVPTIALDCLATVEHEVINRSLKLACIHQNFRTARIFNRDRDLLEFGVRPDQLDGTKQTVVDGRFHWSQRVGRAREFEQGIYEIRESSHRYPDLLVQFFALSRAQV